MATGFIKVKCAKCKNEQMIFGKASTEVKCLVCGEMLSKPSGGKGIMTVPKAEAPAPAAKSEAAEKKKAKAASE